MEQFNQSLLQLCSYIGTQADMPTAGKLDPKWEGGWIVEAIKGPTSYKMHTSPDFGKESSHLL